MPTILIVDDDEATLELYERVLSGRFQVRTCGSVTEARNLLQNQPIDAVVLDPYWPDQAGWELAAWLGQFPTPVPFILCSALGERKRGLALGASAYLVKPVLPQTLAYELICVLNLES
jgi:DNA-binding response OmpR family regulator